ncbi:hypothetical protein EYF80_054634 [Liparis tanakae]|uniref:Uncharacterized protein n=1 Tax=Liparis tanakae TaxID=230148 RepID=A0A4Z2F2R2_9TELE|nr:hypothetical protein EYF80_054634 [Liparis tanakae]
MTLRVCMPTEQEASSPRGRPADALVAGMDESSMHWPHRPVCQWYTVQGWSLQFLTSCRALLLGHWRPPERRGDAKQHPMRDQSGGDRRQEATQGAERLHNDQKVWAQARMERARVWMPSVFFPEQMKIKMIMWRMQKESEY